MLNIAKSFLENNYDVTPDIAEKAAANMVNMYLAHVKHSGETATNDKFKGFIRCLNVEAIINTFELPPVYRAFCEYDPYDEATYGDTVIELHGHQHRGKWVEGYLAPVYGMLDKEGNRSIGWAICTEVMDMENATVDDDNALVGPLIAYPIIFDTIVRLK